MIWAMAHIGWRVKMWIVFSVKEENCLIMRWLLRFLSFLFHYFINEVRKTRKKPLNLQSQRMQTTRQILRLMSSPRRLWPASLSWSWTLLQVADLQLAFLHNNTIKYRILSSYERKFFWINNVAYEKNE